MPLPRPNFADRIPKWPCFDPAEGEALSRVLASRAWWRGNGTEGDRFEEAFAASLGVRHVRLVANGSLALELVLEGLGVGPGDEVIVPACTFISTASAVLRIGAWPIPVDVEPDTLNIDASRIEAALSPRTRCILPVHMAGQAVDMPAIMAIAARHGIAVVEDAAHAHGAAAFGAKLGTIGAASIFSFQSGKLMTAGEGGAVATNDPHLAERSFALHSCGRPKGDTDYLHLEIATNMRATEFQAAILRCQLDRLPEQLARREQNAPHFAGALAEVGLTPLVRRSYVERHAHYMAVAWMDEARFGDRDAASLARELRAFGIPAFRCFPPVHRTAMFSAEALRKRSVRLRPECAGPDYREFDTPVADAAYSRAIWFHHAVLLGEQSLFGDISEAVAGFTRQAPCRMTA